MQHKYALLALLVLSTSTHALAQQQPAAGATPPELEGILSARAGIEAKRVAFEYFKTSPDAVFNVTVLTIAPGAMIPNHSHPGPEYHYVMTGELQETVGNGQPRALKVGEGQYVPGGTPHELKNAGSQPVQFIVFISGEKGKRLTTPFTR